MNKNHTNHRIRTALKTAASRVSCQINTVKSAVFSQFQSALGANEHLLRLELIEAEALARQTGFPHLMFPELAIEKARKAARWQYHQKYLVRSVYPLAA
jgi:hypothetical protein